MLKSQEHLKNILNCWIRVLKYLHDILFNFKSKRLAMINKDRTFFQYEGGDLDYIISPLTSQLHTASMECPKFSSIKVTYECRL